MPIPQAAPPPYRLHRVVDIVAAGFIGTPLAAFLAMALNYRRLGCGRAACQMVVIGCIWSAAFIPLVLFTGRVFPVLVVAASTAAVYCIAHRRMAALVQIYQHASGKVGSGLELLGVCVAACLPLVLGYWLTSGPGLGQRLTFGPGGEVYYLGGDEGRRAEAGGHPQANRLLQRDGRQDGATG